MRIRKAAAIYSVFIGVSMIGMWTMFYATGNIPELETKPIELAMHLLAEITTAVLLIVGAIGLLRHSQWGKNVYFLATGMLVYTLIQSPGYYLQLGEFPFVVMFGVFLLFAVLFANQVMVDDGDKERLGR